MTLHKTFYAVLLLPLCILTAYPVSSQVHRGSINVRIRYTARQANNRSRITLTESSSQSLQSEVSLNGKTEITLSEIPFGLYILRLYEHDSITSTKYIRVTSSVPLDVVLGQVSGEEVIVEASHISSAVTSTTLNAQAINALPVVSAPKRFESVRLSTPGVVPDEDGRMHIRGEDAQLQYIIDGIPITTNQTRIYSALLNAGIVNSVNIIRGGFNAEYGVAASAVGIISTRSGFEKPFFVNAEAELGSFNSRSTSLSMGGNIDNTASVFFAYANGQTDRYLDPISGFEPNHTDGSTHNYFGKIDLAVTNDITVSLLGSRNLAQFGIPNGSEKIPPQDQRQSVSDYMGALRLTAALSNTSALNVLAYKRHYESQNTSGGLMEIITAEEKAKAAAENEDFFIGAKRENEAVGAQADYTMLTHWFDVENTVKAGIGYESYPLKEYFSFAVTNPSLSNADSAGGDARLLPYDITKGGRPFKVNASNTGSRISGFLQDDIQFENWHISPGIRYDMYSLLEDESALSPRLGIGYRWSDDLTLRFSYNRIVMQAPVENILVSSSAEADSLVGAEQGNIPTNVRSEKEHVIEIGAAYRLDEFIDLDLSAYGKLINDFIVKAELGSSGVIFPVNLKEGMVFGGEFTARLRKWNNISAQLSLSTCFSFGKKPDDGSNPIAAGLILGEEGRNYSHPFGGEDIFPTEHNQLLTAVLESQYQHPSGFFAVLGGRFDSGLPFDLVDAEGNGMDEAASRAYLKRRGYSDDVIDMLSLEGEVENGKISPDKTVAPHFVLDAGIGYDFTKEMDLPIIASVTINNVLDTKYLYKFESSFGGTHFGMPRFVNVALRIKY
jgi:outer membrane receptor protein involved in Fe transport